MQTFKDNWERSYQQGDNHIFYPKEEVVKFMNRYVRKRIGIDQFADVLRPATGGTPLRGLDYGCGIGRMTILMEEFGLQAFGVDISERSIAMACDLARHMGRASMQERFSVIEGDAIPFDDGFFNVTLSEGVLDCMPHETAIRIAGEIDRVTCGLVYLGVDCGDNDLHYREFSGEEFFDNPARVSPGTMHNYYNWQKLQQLFENTRLTIKDAYLMTQESIVKRYRHSRYYVVLQKT